MCKDSAHDKKFLLNFMIIREYTAMEEEAKVKSQIEDLRNYTLPIQRESRLFWINAFVVCFFSFVIHISHCLLILFFPIETSTKEASMAKISDKWMLRISYLISKSSTSNTRVALGGITPPAPRAP